MSTTTTPDIIIGHDTEDDNEVTIPQNALYRHTAAFGAAATGKSTHQHTVMQQLADNGHGFCVLNYRDFELDTLLERLPTHRHDDVLHLDDNTQIYTDDELKNAIENNQIILVEHDMLNTERNQQVEFFTEFLTDYWNTIQNTESDNKHALFIDRFHQLAHTDRFDYPEFLAHARDENLAVHVNAMFPEDLPKDIRDAVFAICGSLLVHRVQTPDDAETLATYLDDVTPTDIMQLDIHNAYTRTADSPDDIVKTELLDPDTQN